MAGVRREVCDPKMHMYVPFHFVYGRKPQHDRGRNSRYTPNTTAIHPAGIVVLVSLAGPQRISHERRLSDTAVDLWSPIVNGNLWQKSYIEWRRKPPEL